MKNEQKRQIKRMGATFARDRFFRAQSPTQGHDRTRRIGGPGGSKDGENAERTKDSETIQETHREKASIYQEVFFFSHK